ncbi:MAG: Crp/Fnr family transcriptional regulator [Clostridia bacterium]|nr:Crp/Fnr family transcriptional regulator [Clostridia bacterium]
MRQYLDVLRDCALFETISDENLVPMLGCLRAKTSKFKKGETVISEGDPADMFGILLSGELQIMRIDYYGNRSIMTNVEPAQLFGESFACAEIEYSPADVVATEDSELLLVDAHRITQTCCNACDFHNRMIFNLLKIVATKNIMFNQKLEITSKRTTREKLMTYLLMQAKKNNSNSFDIPFDRQELADYLEVDRSGLSAEIGKLVKEGKLQCFRSHFTVVEA